MDPRPDVPMQPAPALMGEQGELLTVWITVEPRKLEALLEALAQLDFPVNAQIYHRACLVGVRADGSEEEHPTLLVEFPAWSRRLPEIHRVVEKLNLPPHAVSTMPLLVAMRQRAIASPAPADSPYRMIIRYRSREDRRQDPQAGPTLLSRAPDKA